MGGKIRAPAARGSTGWWLSAIAVLAAACGNPKPPPRVDPNATPVYPPQPLSKVFVLESWGAAPEDTVVRFPAAQPRTVVVRRGAPDNNLFARLVFPAGSLTPASGDSVTIRLRIRPGLYGIDLDTDAQVHPGAEITFSYAIHFEAPEEARKAYGSDIRFERFLGIGRLPAAGDTILVFLDSWRAASDMLTAPIPGTGRYLVAAPQARPRFKAISF